MSFARRSCWARSTLARDVAQLTFELDSLMLGSKLRVQVLRDPAAFDRARLAIRQRLAPCRPAGRGPGPALQPPAEHDGGAGNSGPDSVTELSDICIHFSDNPHL